jgi:hypothetical protein
LETCCGYGYGLPPKLHSRTRIFKGRRKRSGPRKNRAALCRHRPYLRANLFHGLERLKKKRQLSPGLPPTSPCWLALPHWLPKEQSRCAGSGILTRFPFAQSETYGKYVSASEGVSPSRLGPADPCSTAVHMEPFSTSVLKVLT